MNTKINRTKPSLCQDHRSEGYSLELDRLATLTMAELQLVYDAASHALDAFGGYLNQPRASSSAFGSITYNSGGAEIDRLAELMGRLMDAAMMAAMEARPANANDARTRAWLILSHAAKCEESLPEIVVTAAELAFIQDGLS